MNNRKPGNLQTTRKRSGRVILSMLLAATVMFSGISYAAAEEELPQTTPVQTDTVGEQPEQSAGAEQQGAQTPDSGQEASGNQDPSAGVETPAAQSPASGQEMPASQEQNAGNEAQQNGIEQTPADVLPGTSQPETNTDPAGTVTDPEAKSAPKLALKAAPNSALGAGNDSDQEGSGSGNDPEGNDPDTNDEGSGTDAAAAEMILLKVWEDNGDSDKCRPTVEQYRDLVKANKLILKDQSGAAVDLSQQGIEIGVVDGQAYADANQNFIVEDRQTNTKLLSLIQTKDTYLVTIKGLPEGQYTLDGDTVDNYACSVDGFVITNTRAVSVSVTKSWADNNDQDGKRPTAVTVKLMKTLADGSKVEAGSATLPENDQWTHTWEGLAKYEDSVLVNYSVEEAAVDFYTPSYSSAGDEDKADWTVTNTHTPETITVTAVKEWRDDNNRDGIRPDSVTVKILSGSKEAGYTDTGYTLTMNAANKWTAAKAGLPKYKEGKELEYKLEEVPVKGYTPVIYAPDTGRSYFEVINTHNPELTRIKVKKVWADENDKDKIRPAEVTVHLIANGKEAGTAKLNSSNNWSTVFEKQYVYENGTAVTYSLREDTVKGYTTSITGDAAKGYTVTNTHTPVVTPEDPLSISVTKTWDDNNNAAKQRPASITVNLLADGVVVRTANLTEAMGWKTVFTGLPATKDNKAIAYTVQENAVTGYVAAVSGSAKEGFVIVNKRATAAGGGAAGGTNSTIATPRTGDSSHMGLWMILILAALAGVIAGVVILRKQRQNIDQNS